MKIRLDLLVAMVYDNKAKREQFNDAIAMIAYDYNMTKKEVARDMDLVQQALREVVAQ